MLRLFIVYLFITVCNFAQAGDINTASPAGSQATFIFSPNVALHLKASAFDAKNHHVSRCKVNDWEGVCLIDGKPIIGTDWDMPKFALESFELEVNGTRVALDVSSLYNPWFGAPAKEHFSVSPVEGGWVVHGCFSDGAGTYIAEWLVVGGGSLRTLISGDESVIDLFPCVSNVGGERPNTALQGTRRKKAAPHP